MEGEKEDDTFVQVYAPAQKEVLPEPNDPFFAWKKIGKVVRDREGQVAQVGADDGQPDRALPAGQGLLVSVNASTKVCTKAEAKKLAPSMK